MGKKSNEIDMNQNTMIKKNGKDSKASVEKIKK